MAPFGEGFTPEQIEAWCKTHPEANESECDQYRDGISNYDPDQDSTSWTPGTSTTGTSGSTAQGGLPPGWCPPPDCYQKCALQDKEKRKACIIMNKAHEEKMKGLGCRTVCSTKAVGKSCRKKKSAKKACKKKAKPCKKKAKKCKR